MRTTIAIDASGGTASADASGGDNNVAIAGGGQVGTDAAVQTVELSTLTLELEGNVVPGKLTTYWVDTDRGRRPASGPALVQVAEEPDNAGAIIAEARVCPIAQPQEGYDWFGQCATPAPDMSFSLSSPNGGDGTLPGTAETNAQGRARFGELAPGAYLLQPEPRERSGVTPRATASMPTATCWSKLDLESHVWSFVCGGPGGS